MKNILAVISLCITMCLVLAGCSDVPNSATAQTPSDSFVIPDPISYRGSGDDVISISPIDDIYVFRILGNEKGSLFAVTGYDADGNYVDLLVNTTEPYNGITIDPSLSIRTLEISAKGDWRVDVVSIYEMPIINQGDIIDGAGDSVYLVASSGTTATISGNRDGNHFAVWSYGKSGSNLLVNTTDPYKGTVMVKGDPMILSVKSKGVWTIHWDPEATTNRSPESAPGSDDRGISGMTATAFLLTADNSFDVPYSKEVSEVLEYSAYTCVSSGISDGVFYDYSISLDSDNEIIGASIGVSSTDVTETELFYAADLYYYALAISIFDDPEKETLVTWFEDSLPDATNGVSPITIGGATFELYCTGSMYWVDISKAS